MKLVIAEKPSVAQSLARVIGANKRQDGYLEGGGYLVSWCVGHLVELSVPERYDERFAKWRLEDLPILPERFLYEVSAGTRKQYQILRGLMERSDVESLVCATDAGREGELIFRLVYTQARCKKPFERLWISSMEDAAIREGFEKLKPGTSYDLLYEAALCRERAANRILGFTAQQTLDYTQSLYEKKLVTYPRTDSRYLTEDMQPVIPELVRTVAAYYGLPVDSLRTEPVRKGSVFDSGKVTDHYAIIPTKSISGSDASSLSSAETAVLQLISVRLLCAMQEDYRYAETSVKFSCRGEEFTQKGRTVLQTGWKAIWNSFFPEKKKEDESSGTVPAQGSIMKIDSVDVKEGKTSPPKHFTEDTLLSAMETVGADETPEEAERKGLGTPATRAATSWV